MESDSGGRFELAWDGGRMDLDVPAGDAETGEALRLLRGSRLITDWESRYPSQEALSPLAKRQESRVAARLPELSRTYGLASREMSLVAVVKRRGDRTGGLPRRAWYLLACPGHVVPGIFSSICRENRRRRIQAAIFKGSVSSGGSGGRIFGILRRPATIKASGSHNRQCRGAKY
jgi:hypothetical protein